ncbi:CCA tRNA nucleotidyltransferase [Microbaculum marinum]|uniref:CCA tRNA nucleotidyltransferase n=1 Tax=Microbaculum marinum TaxID=1764581 RepID=A0AAW9RJ33_9HYPH
MSEATPVLDIDWDTGWLREPALVKVIAALNTHGVETRVVGGAVRDAILGHPRGDVDLATTGSTDEVDRLATAAGLKAVPTGVAHGTMTVVSDGRPFEVTTLRHDVETHGRHATVAFGAAWEEDARRRDFTMNALYADRDGRLYDWVGGYPDLMARRVRFIGDPEARIREDFLRILRFFRFHAQFGHGAPDADGLAAAIRQRLGVLGLSGERLRQELLRLLVAPGAAATVEVMADCGILGLVTGGVAYIGSLEREVAVEAAEASPPDALMRLAAVAIAIPEDAERISDRLRLSNAQRHRLQAAAAGWWHVGPHLSEAVRKALLYRQGAQTYRDRATLAFARSGMAADDPEWRALRALPDRWPVPQLPVKGADIVALGIPAGPAIGAIISRLETEWIESDFSLRRDELLARAAAANQ